MLELGETANATFNKYVANPTLNKISNSPKVKPSPKKIYDDAAAAVITRQPQTQTSSKTQVETTEKAAENSEHAIFSDVSELLRFIRKELKSINSFDGFLIGVHNKIEKFQRPAEFSLKQISEIERNISQQNMTLELGMFSLARIHKQALKVLRCQNSLNPERVLHLLNPA